MKEGSSENLLPFIQNGFHATSSYHFEDSKYIKNSNAIS